MVKTDYPKTNVVDSVEVVKIKMRGRGGLTSAHQLATSRRMKSSSTRGKALDAVSLPTLFLRDHLEYDPLCLEPYNF